MKKSSYRVLAEAVIFNGLKNINLNVKPTKRLTKEQLTRIIKEEFEDAKEAEDTDVLDNLNWGDPEVKKDTVDWAKKLDIKKRNLFKK